MKSLSTTACIAGGFVVALLITEFVPGVRESTVLAIGFCGVIFAILSLRDS